MRDTRPARKRGAMLDAIVAHHRAALPERKRQRPEAELRALARLAPECRDFTAAVCAPGVSLIAECKKASPSKGLLAPGYDPVSLATTYEEAGAAAVSVLTDAPHFQGSLAHLQDVKAAVTIPVLRKDFIFDDYQLYESRAFGADAVLLIAAVLGKDELRHLLERTLALGMSALVEVHSEEEVGWAPDVNPPVVGINNRDLKTFKVDFARTARLRRSLPEDVPVVGESGVRGPADVVALRQAGLDAVLVGESLVRSRDPLAAARAMVAAGRDHPAART